MGWEEAGERWGGVAWGVWEGRCDDTASFLFVCVCLEGEVCCCSDGRRQGRVEGRGRRTERTCPLCALSILRSRSRSGGPRSLACPDKQTPPGHENTKAMSFASVVYGSRIISLSSRMHSSPFALACCSPVSGRELRGCVWTRHLRCPPPLVRVTKVTTPSRLTRSS